MRVYDGLQRFELYRSIARGQLARGEHEIPAHEFVGALRYGPRESIERLVDFLVRDFAWTPTDFDRHDAALDRISELIASGRVAVVAFRPSGSIEGDVPDEGDVQELSELAAESTDELAAGSIIEAPMGIEPEFALEPPVGFDTSFEVEDPDMPAFEYALG